MEVWCKKKLDRKETLQTSTNGKVLCMALDSDEEVLVIGTSNGRIQVTDIIYLFANYINFSCQTTNQYKIYWIAGMGIRLILMPCIHGRCDYMQSESSIQHSFSRNKHPHMRADA